MKILTGIIITSLILFSCSDHTATTSPYSEWKTYAGSKDGSRYSSNDQITPQNVSQLRVAWTFSSNDKDPDNHSQNQCNPIVVDGLLYGTTQSGGTKAVGTVYSLNVPMAPKFRSITQSGGTVNFSWSSVAGRLYQLQYITDPTQTNWANLGIASNAVSGITSGSDLIGPAPRFYQLQLISP